jgi:hypothetical protein
MGSSGGGGGGNPAHLMMGASPMAGLPVAGANGAVSDPFNYGKYQSFLPNPVAEGQNEMATGLRPDMFNYRSPKDIMAGNAGAPPGDNTGSQIQELRDQLAKLQAGAIGGRNQFGAADEDQRWAIHDALKQTAYQSQIGGA